LEHPCRRRLILPEARSAAADLSRPPTQSRTRARCVLCPAQPVDKFGRIHFEVLRKPQQAGQAEIPFPTLDGRHEREEPGAASSPPCDPQNGPYGLSDRLVQRSRRVLAKGQSPGAPTPTRPWMSHDRNSDGTPESRRL
jgi:hypothetical protein